MNGSSEYENKGKKTIANLFFPGPEVRHLIPTTAIQEQGICKVLFGSDLLSYSHTL